MTAYLAVRCSCSGCSGRFSARAALSIHVDEPSWDRQPEEKLRCGGGAAGERICEERNDVGHRRAAFNAE